MANITWGDGSLWGGATPIPLFGRIGANLEAAQLAKVRQTGLRVQVKDERLNLWDYHAGTHSFPDVGLGNGLYAPVNGTFKSWQIEFYAFRGGSAMCVLGNGNIVRVRWGDPANSSDRQLWIQTVTDPEILSQWTSWSVQYSGTHYGAMVISDGTASGFIIYHSKADGIYRNNVKQWEPSAAQGKALNWVPVVGMPDAGWVVTIRKSAVNGKRIGDAYWTADLTTDTPVFDQNNYAWHRGALTAIPDANGKIVRIGANSLHFNPRDGDHGIAIYHQIMDPTTLEMTPPYVIRGVGGGAGLNYISGLTLNPLSDGYYYLSGSEIHQDVTLDGATSLGYGMPIWMRSKDLKHWSEPVVGPAVSNGWGGNGGYVESNGYIYWADTEVVYRRPIGTITYDISNYVPTIEFELPRDNQPGKGTAAVSNPEGVNNSLLTLADREIIVEPGLRIESGAYEFKAFDRFFVKQTTREIQGKTNRLNVEFGNIWNRLDTDFRDITNHIGQIDWKDWAPGRRNKAFNYFFVTDTAPVETSDFRLTTRGNVLYTGWKGHNPDVTVSFSNFTGNVRIIAKYKDNNNFEYFEYNKATGVLTYWHYANGNGTQIDSWNTVADSTPRIRIQKRWNFYRVWVNNVEYGTAATQFVDEPKQPFPGYVGFGTSAGSYTISGFELKDWEAILHSDDLIRTALAMGDFHDVIVGGATSRIYALVWGPQTDAKTPAEALRQTLEIDKLQLIWRNGYVEVGKFNDRQPVRTIENEIVESDEIEEVNRRINFAAVDGNEHHWLEVDTADARTRGRHISSYFDLPELLDEEAVVERAREEIRRGAQGASPGGTTPLFFDVWRMDAVTWVDNTGEEKLVRVEGYTVEINQSTTPSQRQTFDTSYFSDGSDDGLNSRSPVVVGGAE